MKKKLSGWMILWITASLMWLCFIVLMALSEWPSVEKIEDKWAKELIEALKDYESGHEDPHMIIQKIEKLLEERATQARKEGVVSLFQHMYGDAIRGARQKYEPQIGKVPSQQKRLILLLATAWLMPTAFVYFLGLGIGRVFKDFTGREKPPEGLAALEEENAALKRQIEALREKSE